ncbi:MAG: Fic family protein [Moraxellaceae bacterium]
MTSNDYESVKQQLAAVNPHSSRAEMEAADNLERRITTARIARLKESPIQGNYDFKHLAMIHERIFTGLYDHAGQVRDFDFHKYSPVRERSDFAPFGQVVAMIDEVALQLAAQNHLKQLSQVDFIDALTPIYAAINHAHPFEEGNGRAAQTMIAQLVKDAGYDLKFDLLNRAEWALACSKAMPHSRMHEGVVPYAQPIDLKPLQQQLAKIVVSLV